LNKACQNARCVGDALATIEEKNKQEESECTIKKLEEKYI